MPFVHGQLLVPTNFSRSSRQAYGVALEMALGSGAAVTLLHVTPPEPAPVGLDAMALLTNVLWLPRSQVPCTPTYACGPGAPLEAMEQMKRQVHPEWAAMIDVRLVCRTGDIAAEIVRFADTENVDLIVLGGGTRRSSARLPFRTRLCERVVRMSPLRVVVVHPVPDRTPSRAAAVCT